MASKKNTFFEGAIPQGYNMFFEEDIFNSRKHLQLQADSGWLHFYMINHVDQSVLARFNVHLKDTSAKSPFQSPYGGIEFSDDVSIDLLSDFINYIEVNLKHKGAHELSLKLAPQMYDTKRFSVLSNLLFCNSYKVTESELDASIPINDSDFISRIAKAKRHKLNLCHRLNLTFKRVGIDSYEEVYAFINDNYSKRDYTLSMSKELLKKTIDTFPENYLLFEVRNQGELIGTSIAILVNSKVLYSFYSITKYNYDLCSPSIFLFEGLYKFCREKGIPLLDYGTSALSGQPNIGLLKFKEEIGGQLNLKLTFHKKLVD